MKTKIQIKHRWTGNVLFEHECTTILDCLKEAIKKGAGLRDAYLQGAYLRGAYLQGAGLQGADLRGAYLRGAYLRDADLRGADLQGADLQDADLRDADLNKWKHQIWIIPEEGSFIAWKKCSNSIVAKIQIPARAKRTCNFKNRKCRAEVVKTIGLYDISGKKLKDKKVTGKHGRNTVYEVGKLTYADSFNDDLTNDCTNGIHFFVTFEEAKNW